MIYRLFQKYFFKDHEFRWQSLQWFVAKGINERIDLKVGIPRIRQHDFSTARHSRLVGIPTTNPGRAESVPTTICIADIVSSNFLTCG